MKSCLHVKEPGDSGRKKSRGDSQSISHCNLENSEIKKKLRSGIKIFEDKQRNSSNLSGVVGGSFAVQPKKIDYIDIDSSPDRSVSRPRVGNMSSYDIIKNNLEAPQEVPKKKMFPKMNGTLTLDHPENTY